MKKRLFVSGIVLVSVFVLGLAATASAGETQRKLVAESAIEQIAKRGVIKVGMDIFVPWAMKDKKGELIGFEIDIAKKLAEDMGVKVEFVPTKWSGIIPALTTGKFDVLIGGMTITTKRNLKINFTRPYYYTEQGLMAHKQKAAGFKVSDFNSPNVTIAARLGSTAAIAAKQKFPKAKIRLFDDEPSAVQELRNGNVHAMVSAQPLPSSTAIDYPDTIMVYDEVMMFEAIGIGVRKGDVDTINLINNWIEINRNNGWIQSKYAYWFKSKDWKNLIE
ncbi:MAG: transporter substrate-binding domain-containing protein [Desulfobacterales bacterium]|nr:MAG: transporter substrate-binding domain-containing protein [Desulfobacterales bacterium]